MSHDVAVVSRQLILYRFQVILLEPAGRPHPLLYTISCLDTTATSCDIKKKTAGTCHGMRGNTSLITRTIKSIVLEQVQLLIHCYVFYQANVASEKYGLKISGNSTKLVWRFFVYSEFHIRDSNKVTVIKNLPFSTKTWIACVVVF